MISVTGDLQSSGRGPSREAHIGTPLPKAVARYFTQLTE